jgi:hypothetical protein
MKTQKFINAALFITFLAASLQAENYQGQNFPPPPGGTPGSGFPGSEGGGGPVDECDNPDDCTDLEEPTDPVDSSNPLDGLDSLVASLYDFTGENCNSKKDEIKFQAVVKEVKNVVVKMRKLPGLEEDGDQLSAILEGLKALKTDLKDLCVDESDNVDEEP